MQVKVNNSKSTYFYATAAYVTWLWDFFQVYQAPCFSLIVFVNNICNILLELPQAQKNNVSISYPNLCKV